MRVHINRDFSKHDFANKLLQLGNSVTVSEEHDFISAEDIERNLSTIHELKQAVFFDLVQQYRNLQWLSERAMFVPKNGAVNSTNNFYKNCLVQFLFTNHLIEHVM